MPVSKSPGPVRRRGSGRYHAPEHAAKSTVVDEHRGVHQCWGGGTQGYRERALKPLAGHTALRIKKAQVVAGEPIPSQDDAELRAEVQRRHVDHLAERLSVPQGQVRRGPAGVQTQLETMGLQGGS